MRVPCNWLFSEDTREPHFSPDMRGLFLDKTIFMIRTPFFMACWTALAVILSAPAALGQCFECEIDPGCFGGTYPVLCPSAMPDATVGEYYEESATFHLPPIVVDPGSGLTVDFLSMTVMTVEGLPAGLVFTPQHPLRGILPRPGRQLWMRGGVRDPFGIGIILCGFDSGGGGVGLRGGGNRV